MNTVSNLLCLSAYRGDKDDVIKQAEHCDFDPNDKDEYGEPLIISLLYFYNTHTQSNKESLEKAIELVLSHKKFNPNQQDQYRDTALIIVARNPKLAKFAKPLIDNPDIRLHMVNSSSLMALDVANIHSNQEVINAIVESPKSFVSMKNQANYRHVE